MHVSLVTYGSRICLLETIPLETRAMLSLLDPSKPAMHELLVLVSARVRAHTYGKYLQTGSLESVLLFFFS